MGLGDFFEGVGDAAVNVTKGVGKAAAWTANPTHWDDIGRGVGNVAEYVKENPGQIWDTGFEVGRNIVKSQLDPKNLAITAGLIGLTVATGGAAAPALAAEVGEAGLAGGEAIAATTGAIKGVQAGSSALKAGEAVAEGAEAVSTLSRGQKFVEGVQSIGTGIKESSGFQKLDSVLNAPREFIGTAREGIGLSRYGGFAEQRAGMASKVLEGGEGEAGFVRQQVAKRVAGSSNPLNPVASSNYSKMGTRFGQVQHAFQAPGEVGDHLHAARRDIEIAANPEKAAMDYAMKRANSQFLQPAQTPQPTYSGPDTDVPQVQSMNWGNTSTSGAFAGRSGSSYSAGRGFSNTSRFPSMASSEGMY